MPQEIYNAQWIREQRAGVLIKRLRELKPAVQSVTRELERYRTELAKVNNRAVFEIPAILQEILTRSAASRTAVAA